MVTRLYLHSSTSGLPSGTLPSAEQSTLTADDNFEANQATNRKMSRLIGTSETSLANTSLGASTLKNYYIGRWVSDPINQTSVAANTWTYSIAAQATGTGARFPAANTGTLYVNCYVWKPSNGTKYGTILDGATTALGGSGGTSKFARNVTFTGSAVSSLTAGDACIVLEVWATVTQGDTSTYTQTFYFDGRVTNNVEGAVVTDHATFLQTPENIAFTESTAYAETKLYLHNTTTGIPTGTLPTAEQSSKTVTASCNFEGSQTTNRLMDTSIGVSQASLALATPANTSANVYYVSRWVSPVIQDTTVPAASWEYNFAAKESSTSANYPVTATAKAVAMCAYVWKPSDGTKYGNIFDGNTAGITYNEGAANTEISEHGNFIGASVASLTAGDACIVFEAWFNVTQGAATSFTDTYYYDGTTETLTTGTTVSNHASFINLLNTALDFSAGTTPVNQTYTHKYKIAALVSQTRTHIYKIIGRIIQTYTHKYNIRALVNATKTHIYKIRALVNRTRTHIYKIVGRIAKTYTHIYKIVGRALQTFTHKYNIKLLVSRTRTHIYKIVGRVVNTFTHLYKIRALVNRTRTHIYKIVGRASQVFTHLYKIRQLASQTYTHLYKIRQLVNQTYTHLYKIVGRATQNFTHLYKIRLLVNQTYTHLYKIRQLVTQTRTHIYKIIGRASQTFTHKYRILILATQTFTHKYKLRQLAIQTFTHIYKIISEQLVANRAFTHIYKIVGRTTQTYTHKYNIKQLVNRLLTHKYNIKQLVNQIKTFKYNILILVNQAYTHRYRIAILASQIFTHKYKLRQLVNNTFTHIYKIFSNLIQVNQTFTHLYRIRSIPDLIPLYLQSTVRKIESGWDAFAWRDRFRSSESYVRQMGNKAVRKYLIRSRRAG